MRIVEVHADAFGPLRMQSLPLAPGLTVVHGPNEAGKSSWFAAIYAGLAGRRRARGRGTQAQAQFAARHRPWSGSQWTVGMTLTLDDGTSLGLKHDLRKGESRVVDATTGRALGIDALERRLGRPLTTDGGLDGARILGLHRDAARATIFVGQADVLRVLHDAGELQELLERVATTETADVTAEAALRWLSNVRSERVGVPHVGMKPLRARTLALGSAREAAVRARDLHAQLAAVLEEAHQTDQTLRRVSERLAELERLQAWSAAIDLQQRVDRARTLFRAAEDDGVEPADDAVVTRARMALAALRERGPRPSLPEGEDAAAIRQIIADLPAPPAGDLEPRPAVSNARDALAAAEAAVATHSSAQPTPPSELGPDLDADELRDLATCLEEPVLEVDAALEEQLAVEKRQHEAALSDYQDALAAQQLLIEQQAQAQRDYETRWAQFEEEQDTFVQRRTNYENQVKAAREEDVRRAAEAARARRTATLLIGGAGVFFLTAIVLVGLGLAVPGAVLAAIAVLAVGAGLVRRGQVTTNSPAARFEPPVAPVPPEAVRFDAPQPVVRPELPERVREMEAQLAARAAAMTHAETRRAQAVRRLGELGLGTNPVELRQLARALDDAADAAVRLERHETKRIELERARLHAARTLAAELGATDLDLSTAQARMELVTLFDEYVEGCRTRARQAAEAARRADLEQALAQRTELEQAHARAIEDWEGREQAVDELVRALRSAEADPADAAEWLHRWLEEQEVHREQAARREKSRAALNEILDGRTFSDFEQEAVAARPEGPAPDVIPADLNSQLERLRHQHERLLDQSGSLRGQQSQLVADMPSLAAALETESDAEASLAVVEELAAGLEVATAELERAKERTHASVAPALESSLRPWVPAVTRGRYLDVAINPADLTMTVTDQSGITRDAHLLSHGTTEQLYLLLRIALARHLASVDETAPLVLDDVTVQSDAIRTRAVLDLLHVVSRDRQVVLFSQEDEVVAWAREFLTEPQDRLVSLPDPVQ